MPMKVGFLAPTLDLSDMLFTHWLEQSFKMTNNYVGPLLKRFYWVLLALEIKDSTPKLAHKNST